MRYHEIMSETVALTGYPVLYHGTSSKHLKPILDVGLTAPNNWGSLAVARYFAGATCSQCAKGGHLRRPRLFRALLGVTLESGIIIGLCLRLDPHSVLKSRDSRI